MQTPINSKHKTIIKAFGLKLRHRNETPKPLGKQLSQLNHKSLERKSHEFFYIPLVELCFTLTSKIEILKFIRRICHFTQ